MLDPDISTADAHALLTARDDDPDGVSRRRFLQLVGAGVGTGALTGLDGLLPGADRAWSAGPIGAHDGVLVIIGMNGGNDGFNTVVPLDNANLEHYRPAAMRTSPGSTHRLNAHLGLHPALGKFKSLWDQGQLAIVQGVGYPNQDLSHFNSMAIWMSAIRNGTRSTGWVGRWLDGRYSKRNLYAAASIGSGVPLHMVGNVRRATAVAPGKPGFGGQTRAPDRRLYRALRDIADNGQGGWMGAISGTFRDQLDVAQRIGPIMPAQPPSKEIVAKLSAAARLINANLGFRVIEVSWADFDSHRAQPTMHTDRMRELDAGVRAFYSLLNSRWSTRVTLMTFSEFGRTPWSNDSNGTDHGSANCAFVFGKNVKGGFYGSSPSLAGITRWERQPFKVDFRSYYASMIDGWLGGGSSDVLGKRYENLHLFRRSPGVG